MKDIFGRKSQSSSVDSPKKPTEINQDARELEDLLDVSNERSSYRNANRSSSQSVETPQTRPQQTQAVPQRHTSPADFGGTQKSDDDRAVVLIRAMVNAGKADGRIDENEQQRILEKVGSRSRENIDFLRRLFAEPLDIQEFVRSVPFGMEQQVYTMSLIAIDLDEASEANYLMKLAEGLRIPTDVREQIHQRLGAPSIY